MRRKEWEGLCEEGIILSIHSTIYCCKIKFNYLYRDTCVLVCGPCCITYMCLCDVCVCVCVCVL